MSDHFELLDIYKAVISMVAGLILGFEREMKDKSAGLKTITIICLGSTLFSIISYKLAGVGDPTRIASYVVSGIGFLGAGVIFKEGFTVYGLTTAGVIWIAAAIGVSIGFGEVYMAFTFLIAAIIVVNSATYITKHFMPQSFNKIVKIQLLEANFPQKPAILKEIKSIATNLSEIAIEKKDGHILITLDLQIGPKEIEKLEEYLTTNPNLDYFSY